MARDEFFVPFSLTQTLASAGVVLPSPCPSRRPRETVHTAVTDNALQLLKKRYCHFAKPNKLMDSDNYRPWLLTSQKERQSGLIKE